MAILVLLVRGTVIAFIGRKGHPILTLCRRGRLAHVGVDRSIGMVLLLLLLLLLDLL